MRHYSPSFFASLHLMKCFLPTVREIIHQRIQKFAKCTKVISHIFFLGRNIGMFGVQSVAMGCPAHLALFYPIWNHPAGENSQKRKFGSLKGGGLILGSAFAFAIFGCSHNFCAGELPRSASSHFQCHQG